MSANNYPSPKAAFSSQVSKIVKESQGCNAEPDTSLQQAPTGTRRTGSSSEKGNQECGCFPVMTECLCFIGYDCRSLSPGRLVPLKM